MVQRSGPDTGPGPEIVGVDFTSAPSARKPITLAAGRLQAGGLLRIDRTASFADWAAFEGWLGSGHACRSGHSCLSGGSDAGDQAGWVAAFDFPFGLPRAFVESLGWPTDGPEPWSGVTRRVAALTRPELVDLCRAYCAARPVGMKFAHRATDATAGSSPSMKWVNPPVVLMLHAGAPRLLAADVTLPGLRQGDPSRVALEGYPGLLARDVLGRESYKSDDRRKDDAARRDARRRLVQALEEGRHRMALRVAFGAIRKACIDEPMADRLDAVLCAVEAAWAWQQRDAGWGMPLRDDRLEGWIVGA
jgi:hypothetical protein